MKIATSLRCLLFGAFIYQVLSLTGAFKFLSTPGQHIKGIRGSSLNFTWEFTTSPSSPTTLQRIIFGIWNSKYGFLDKNLLLMYRRNSRGPWKFITNKDAVVHGYIGRVRWVGDLSEHARFRASFELLDIKEQDASVYAIQIDLRDEYGTTESDHTNLTVLPPSLFISSKKTVYTGLGSQATFTWTYSLNEDETQALEAITWGFYKNKFITLCAIKISNFAAQTQTCELGHGKKANFGSILTPTSMATFVLNDVSLADEGEYQIRLEGTTPLLIGKTNLYVTDPPVIIMHPKPQSVIEGKPLNLTCAAYGRPEPSYDWLKNGHVIGRNLNSSFVIENTTRKNAGMYQCKAINSVGNVTSSEANVVVHYAPRVSSMKKIVKVKVPLKSQELLTCPAIGNPSPTYKWYKNGEPYDSSGHQIQVYVETKHQYVNYTCRAINYIGEDNTTFVLVQVGPPSNPKVDCGKQEDTAFSRLRKLHWTTPRSDGGAPLLCYTVKHREIFSHLRRGPWVEKNVSVLATWFPLRLDWGKTYELSVTAWNQYGESKADLKDDSNSCIVKVERDPKEQNQSSTEEPQGSARPRVAGTAEPYLPYNLNRRPCIDKMTTGNILLTYTVRSIAESNDFVDKIPGGKVALYVGIAGVCLVVIIVAVVIRRRHVRQTKDKVTAWTNQQMSISGHMEGDFWEGPSAGGSRLGSGESRNLSKVGSPEFHFDPNWTVPREKISVLKVIGNGAFGLVYKGRVHGLGTNRPGWNLVAIKSPYADATDAETRDLMKEFELLKTLKPHPHVIRLLGCGEDDGRPLIIIEYVPFGDLLGYLRKSRGEEDDYYSDPEIKPQTSLSSSQLLRFAWQISDGMAYLSSEKIIHRDLASRNVLVGEGEVCKITDFGMAKDVSNEDIYIRRTEGRLPVKWTAIEALIGGGEYTTQSDVWSFGVVLYEICTIGGDPYPGIAGKDIPDLLETGYRMPCPGHLDATLYEVMSSCWQTYPDDRPTFTSLQKILATLEAVQSKDYINLAACMNQSGRGKTPAKEGNKYQKSPGVPDSSGPAVAV